MHRSRCHVLDDPVHVVPDGGEDRGDADAALFGAEGDDAGEVHGAVDAAGAGDEGTAAVAVARITVWKGWNTLWISIIGYCDLCDHFSRISR